MVKFKKVRYWLQNNHLRRIRIITIPKRRNYTENKRITIMAKKEEKQRKNTVGRYSEYGEKTVTWAFRCPISKLDYMKSFVKAKLDTFRTTKP